MFSDDLKKHISKINHHYETLWIQVVSVFLFVLGFVNIASAWFSFDYPRIKLLKEFFGYHIIVGSRLLVLITGLAALIVAPALYRQKRVAWYAAVLIFGISGLAHILKGADIEEASFCLVLFGTLLPLFKYCKVKSDQIRLIHGGKILIALVGFVILYTILGLIIFSDHLGINLEHYPIWKVILDALMFDTSDLHPLTRGARFYVDTLFIINSLAYLIGLFFVLSPVIARSIPDSNLDTYKRLAEINSSQPVQHFTLGNEYQHFYYKTEVTEGFISYMVSHRVALSIGNPCLSGSLEDLTSHWLNMVYDYDWIPAVYQAQGDFVCTMQEKGFLAVPVGVEAVVNLKKFSLAGKDMQDIRTAKNKAVKEGWVIRTYEKSDWNKVRLLDSKWVAIHGNSEIQFAMGRSTPKYLESTRTVLLFDKDNNLLAYVNNIDLLQTNARSIDLMRRDPELARGAMEYLILHEILAAQQEEKDFYDLGFSPLAKIDEAFSDNKTVIRLFKLIFEKQRRYYDFQGLHKFKSKFLPNWNQSYLIYPSILELPNVLMALLELNKGKV